MPLGELERERSDELVFALLLPLLAALTPAILSFAWLAFDLPRPPLPWPLLSFLRFDLLLLRASSAGCTAASAAVFATNLRRLFLPLADLLLALPMFVSSSPGALGGGDGA